MMYYLCSHMELYAINITLCVMGFFDVQLK